MSKGLLYVLSILVFISVGGLVYFGLMPKPINSEKIEPGQDLELANVYPGSSTEKGSFYQGKLYKSGKINVVVMEGTYEEMGRQYGVLLADELIKNYDGIIENLQKIDTITREEIQEYGEMMYNTYPYKYRQIVEGLAESSGLGLEKAKFLLGQELYVYAGLLAIAKGENVSGSSNCSGIAAWGDYTQNGEMIFGRNYDLGPTNHEYVTMAVYNPIDGSMPSASLTYAGAIYVTSGMNRSGLMLELNNGSSSDPGDFSGVRTPSIISLFDALEQNTNLDELNTFFNTTLPDMAYIINSADSNGAVSFEWSTSGVKTRQPDKNGLLAATNLFFDPSWGKQSYDVAKDSDAIVKRRDNLLALGEKYKGQINSEKMMEIIALPLKDGGSFRAPNFTSYEYVAEPSTLDMWIRVPEYQDWTKVNLAQLFNKN